MGFKSIGGQRSEFTPGDGSKLAKVIVHKSIEVLFCFVTSGCTTELTSRVFHPPPWQEVDFEVKHQQVDQPLAVLTSRRGNRSTGNLD